MVNIKIIFIKNIFWIFKNESFFCHRQNLGSILNHRPFLDLNKFFHRIGRMIFEKQFLLSRQVFIQTFESCQNLQLLFDEFVFGQFADFGVSFKLHQFLTKTSGLKQKMSLCNAKWLVNYVHGTLKLFVTFLRFK